MALLTDLYQLTMAYAYWHAQKSHLEASFNLFFRRSPFQGGYALTAGLESVIDFIKTFRFDTSDLDYLATLKGNDGQPLFPDAFLRYLSDLRLEVDLYAMPEGTVAFPQEPIIRVDGPIIHCQLLESPLLNLINFPTLVATKASRLRAVCGKDLIFEFGLRRAQGINGALTASRAAYVGGCDSTSNVLAGKLFGIPVRGTHSHSWVMAFDEEIESFYAFANALPANCVFLVDTYNSLEGVRHAIKVGKWLREEKNQEMIGIRLDSGDLAYLSIQARKMLDEAGFAQAKIFASNELDEMVIQDLKRQKAPIGVWGVGTNLVTARDQPALDGVYKLSAIREVGKKWDYRLKLSEQMIKVSNPGHLQVRRYIEKGEYIADAIYDDSGLLSPDLSRGALIVDPLDMTRKKRLSSHILSEDLLVPIFEKGECVYKKPSLKAIRQYGMDSLAKFPDGVKRFYNPHQYIVGMEAALHQKKIEMIQKIRERIEEGK